MISIMRTIMNIEELSTIEALQNSLKGDEVTAYSVLGDKTESYQFTRKALVKFNYATCSKLDKGVARRFLLKLTGYSNPQLRRLIGKYK
jgi:hypothetical protein